MTSTSNRNPRKHNGGTEYVGKRLEQKFWGGELNPAAIKQGYITANGNITQTIDTSKTYIVATSANYNNASAILLDTYKVENGVVTAIYDAPLFTAVSVTVSSGTTLKIANGSTSISISYTIIQLN